jgi:Phage major capsid protein E/ParB-like nuclease domain
VTDAPQAPGLIALAERIELWSIDRLRPYERNPRTHSEVQVDQIAASMVEFGWTNPVLIDEQGGIHAICGADFFDDLITHSEVEKAYERYLDGAFLRQGQARGSFE